MKNLLDPSQPLRNARHERFAQLVAQGKGSDMAVYVLAGYSPKAANQNATLLRGNAGIKARIVWLQSQAAGETVLSVKEKREFYALVVRTPLAQVDEKSVLCQSVKYTEDGKEIKMPCKLAAIRGDNDLAGDGSEAGLHDALTDEIERIRGKR